MRAYETMFIIDPHLDESVRKETIDKVKEFISQNGGTVKKVDDWGIRELAYEIKKRNEGHYVVIEFETENNQLALKLRDYFRFEPNILRSIVVREDE